MHGKVGDPEGALTRLVRGGGGGGGLVQANLLQQLC